MRTVKQEIQYCKALLKATDHPIQFGKATAQSDGKTYAGIMGRLLLILIGLLSVWFIREIFRSNNRTRTIPEDHEPQRFCTGYRKNQFGQTESYDQNGVTIDAWYRNDFGNA